MRICGNSETQKVSKKKIFLKDGGTGAKINCLAHSRTPSHYQLDCQQFRTTYGMAITGEAVATVTEVVAMQRWN